MKRGTADDLQIYMCVNYEDVDHIDFIFKDIKSETADVILTKNYPTDCTLDSETGILSIPFTADETYLFSGRFYMDTKITMQDGSNPETEIVTLNMKPTLFEQEVQG